MRGVAVAIGDLTRLYNSVRWSACRRVCVPSPAVLKAESPQPPGSRSVPTSWRDYLCLLMARPRMPPSTDSEPEARLPGSALSPGESDGLRHSAFVLHYVRAGQR